MYCCNSSTIYTGCGDPIPYSGCDGDVYLNISTMNFLKKDGCCWRVVGNASSACNVVANVDFANPNVGARITFNVLANDTFTSPVSSFMITAPLDPVTEGTLTYVNPPNGFVTFTPAPRFLDSAIFGYQISACGSTSSTSSTVGKITANKTYSQTPAILYANGTTQVFILNLNTLASTPIITLPVTTQNIASNRGDALLYHTDVTNTIINMYDYVLGSDGILLDYNIQGFIDTAQSLGFDNTRYFLYVGFNVNNIIAKIAVDPYNRYVTPNTQTFSASPITIGVSGNVSEITVQESTGFLYTTIIPTASPTSFIYKIDPITGATLAFIDTGYLDAHISFANNGLLYGIFGTDEVLINPTTLAFSVIASGAPTVTDLSELLFNM